MRLNQNFYYISDTIPIIPKVGTSSDERQPAVTTNNHQVTSSNQQ